MPAHQGLAPVAAILSDRAIISSQVRGTSYPASANADGEYQTNDLALAPSGAAQNVSPTVPYCFQLSSQYSSTFASTCSGAGTTAPASTRVASSPGCGMNAMSGALPLWTRTTSWASNSREPSYFTSMPVHSSKGTYKSMCGWSSGSTIEV